jgi:ribulose 1,5-bisphosphate carboxylase large subunit-like protein
MKVKGEQCIKFHQDAKNIVATYAIKTLDSPSFAAELIAYEQSSLGSRLVPKVINRFSATVLESYTYSGITIARIVFPSELFGGTLTQLLNVVAGEIHHIKHIDKVKLIGLELPISYISNKINGQERIRNYLGNLEPPYICGAIKPPMGLKVIETAKTAYEALCGGIHIVKDDELMTFRNFNALIYHASQMVKIKKRAEEKCGEKRIYVCNLIGAPYFTPKDLIKLFHIDVDGVLLSPYLQGYEYCKNLIDAVPQLLYFAHNSFMSVYSRSDNHGISLPLLYALTTNAGFDFHVLPSPFGTFIAEKDDINQSLHLSEFVPLSRNSLIGLAGRMNPSHFHLTSHEFLTTNFALVIGSWLFGRKEGIRERAKELRESSKSSR